MTYHFYNSDSHSLPHLLNWLSILHIKSIYSAYQVYYRFICEHITPRWKYQICSRVKTNPILINFSVNHKLPCDRNCNSFVFSKYPYYWCESVGYPIQPHKAACVVLNLSKRPTCPLRAANNKASSFEKFSLFWENLKIHRLIFIIIIILSQNSRISENFRNYASYGTNRSRKSEHLPGEYFHFRYFHCGSTGYKSIN